MLYVIRFTSKGIYCPQADVYLDPWRPVEKAIITHGHSDHARLGMGTYITHPCSVPSIRLRLGPDIRIRTVQFGEAFIINGVRFSLHPAGHIWGSAQVRMEYKGEIWVFSGDYKTKNDGISGEFEPVRCHTFITESTFGLPVFTFPDQAEEFLRVNQWWAENRAAGKACILTGYSLGKAQRLIAGADPSIGPVYLHGAIYNMNRVLIDAGLPIPDYPQLDYTAPRDLYRGALIIAPPSAIGSPWMKRFYPYATAMASGWMNLRGMRRRRAADRGFVISDHADWEELNTAVRETGAERVYVTHGYTSVFSRWLGERGLESYEVKTEFKGETVEPDKEEEDT